MNSYTLLSCIDSKVEHSTKFYGRFELGPFAPGQALTVANALRRSLLSQLSGSAITLLEVKGASNEYEILNGVRESVLDIILNLKQIVFTSDFEIFSPQVGFLNVKGPGIVRASDLKLPAFLYAVDPNQYIATLNTKGQLNMKYLICCGKNYITYTPNDEQYFEWLNLFEKATPSTLQSQKIFKQASSPDFSLKNLAFKNQKCEVNKSLSLRVWPARFFSKDKSQTLFPFSIRKSRLRLGKKTALTYVLPLRGNVGSLKGVLIENETKLDYRLALKKTYLLFNSKKTLKLSFYNKNQENFFAKAKKLVPRETTIDFYKQWIKERGFVKNNFFFIGDLKLNRHFPKNQLLDAELETNFEKKSTKKAIPISKLPTHFFEKTNGKDKLTKSIETETLAPKVTNYKAGYFPIDAIFMPVNRVNYLIESDDNSKFAKDRIILEVWTNGSIHPRHAIHKAAKALIQLFLPLQQMRTTLFQNPAKIFDDAGNLLAKPSGAIQKRKGVEKEKSTRQHLYNQGFDTRILDLDIGNLELKAKPYSSLKMANINTIQDLISYSKTDLLAIKNFELRSLIEVEKALKLLDLELK